MQYCAATYVEKETKYIPEGEVGHKNANPVIKFVKKLLEKDKDGKLHLYSTGLVLTWFGDVGDLEPSIYSAIRK